MISKVRILFVMILLGITWGLLQKSSQVMPIPIKKALGSFPSRIGEYRLSESFQSSAEVVELLGVTDYIQYNYIHSDSSRINLYVGYYESVGTGGGYHSPKNCLPGGGWGIDAVREVPLKTGIEGQDSSKVSEMLIRSGDQYQVVLYWYQNRGRIIASEYWEKIYQVVDALFKRRRDGTFVRIMATVQNGDIEGTELKVQQFAEQVMMQLENYLPGSRL